MKRSLSLGAIFIFMVTQSFSQFTLDWMNPAGDFNKIAVKSVVDNMDNIVVTGYYQSNNIYTRKYDINGNLLWETTDASGMAGLYEKPLGISCDGNNNVYVVGKRYSISSIWEYPDAVVALKYDPDGNLLWKQIIPVSVLVGFPHPTFQAQCEPDSLGNLYIGTAAASPSGFILIKLDSDGNQVFVHNSTANSPAGFMSMKFSNDRIIMTGSGGISSTAPLTTWDTEGNVLWSIAPTGDAGYDCTTDDLGNSFLLTSHPNQVAFNSGQDIVLYKFNTTGEQVWKKDFHFGGSEFATKLTKVGDRISLIGYGTSAAYFDWIIFQTDGEGNLLWNNTYNGTAYNDEYPNAITALSDGTVVTTGTGGPSPSAFNLSYVQMVVLEFDNNGNQIWMDTPNMYGGAGLSAHFASDQSLYLTSYYNMTTYHYNGPPGLITGCMDCLAMNYNPQAQIDDGSCITTCSGDMDYNGSINTNDLLIFITEFGSSGDCLQGDINSDGAVNVADLLTMMVLFGNGC